MGVGARAWHARVRAGRTGPGARRGLASCGPLEAAIRQLEAGLRRPDAALSLSYQGQLAGDARDNGLKGSFDWRF